MHLPYFYSDLHFNSMKLHFLSEKKLPNFNKIYKEVANSVNARNFSFSLYVEVTSIKKFFQIHLA